MYFLAGFRLCTYLLIWTLEIDVTLYSDHWNRQDKIRIKPGVLIPKFTYWLRLFLMSHLIQRVMVTA